ncbi:Positive regulator of CheA protein activity (CheW) [hydrothermal vent metagenome]|uniref:Positive regulator of CheA protein activity (CheW) n=1 Tax=hydrothermal vent metagenome TaxID=652676 RepID=A0A3B0YCL4_9ZZZZ
MQSQNIRVADDSLEHMASELVSQFLTFELNQEIYGVNILGIKEIIDYGSITKVPMVSDCIAGVINLRGSVVPVINLASRFSQTSANRTKKSSVIIVEITYETEKMEVGIAVDVVNEVIDVRESEIEPSPSFGTKIRSDFISGMAKVKDELLVMLNVEKVLSVTELSLLESE